jgi:hypothetical protein
VGVLAISPRILASAKDSNAVIEISQEEMKKHLSIKT